MVLKILSMDLMELITPYNIKLMTRKMDCSYISEFKLLCLCLYETLAVIDDYSVVSILIFTIRLFLYI